MSIYGKRVRTLDGLRGILALVVVLDHFSLTSSWFAQHYHRQIPLVGKPNYARDVFEYSPLHIFFAGQEAVFIFFVISGFVLTIAISGGDSLFSFTRKRLIRLYIPIFASVLFASGLVSMQKNSSKTFDNWWLSANVAKISPGAVIKDLWLFDGNNGINTSLWSMQYELLFSLMIFPLVALYTNNFSSRFKSSFQIVLLFLFIYVGRRLDLSLLTYLPIFILGILIHSTFKVVRYSTTLFFLGIIIVTLPWTLIKFGIYFTDPVNFVFMSAGALLIVMTLVFSNGIVVKFFNLKFCQRLGKYSYSLYLVHAPVISFIFLRMGYTPLFLGWLERVLISLLMIAFCTFVMYVGVEKPLRRYLLKLPTHKE